MQHPSIVLVGRSPHCLSGRGIRDVGVRPVLNAGACHSRVIHASVVVRHDGPPVVIRIHVTVTVSIWSIIGIDVAIVASALEVTNLMPKGVVTGSAAVMNRGESSRKTRINHGRESTDFV